MKRFATIASALIVCMLSASATADIVSYTVGGWSNQFAGPVTPPANAPWGTDGYPGDTVAFQTYTGSLDLTPGTSVQKINTLAWTIDYTYAGTADDPDAWSDLHFAFNAVRSMSFGGGPASNIAQGGILDVTWDNDYLGLSAGPTVTFLVSGYQVDVTPLDLASVGGSNFSGPAAWIQPTRDVMAKFVVSPIPVPAPAAAVLGLIGMGIAAVNKRRSA